MIVALVLGLVLSSAPPSGSTPSEAIAGGRKALHALEYEKALKVLRPVAADDDITARRRAEAWVLIAEAHYGIAAPDADERARIALQKAFKLDIDVELADRADVSPKLVALFDEMRAAALKKQGKAPKTTKPPSTVDDDDDDDPPPNEQPPPSPPQSTEPEPTPAAPSQSLSPWFIGAGAAAGLAVVGAVVVTGSELWLGDVQPGTSADDVRATQGIGVAGVVLTAASVTAAVVAATVGVVTAGEPGEAVGPG